MTYTDKSAVVSKDGVYRYELRRTWARGHNGVLGIVMLNPSTADGEQDDPTIRKCVGFAERNGYEGILILNVFALRATKPQSLLSRAHTSDVIGPANAARFVDLQGLDVLAGWGVWGGHERLAPHVARAQHIIRGVQPKSVMCLGRTKDGQPRHPLMLPYTTTLERFDL